jgi:hypothetical protein
VVVPDRNLLPGELVETPQCAQGIEIIVEDGDVHEGFRRRLNANAVSGFAKITQAAMSPHCAGEPIAIRVV